MPNVKIKQLENRVACSGMHFGLGPLVRKLEPGEVVSLPDDDLFREVFSTDKLELTLEPANRPLAFDSEEEAAMTSPNFKPRDDSQKIEMRRHREAVAARMRKAPVFVNDELKGSADEMPDPQVMSETPPLVDDKDDEPPQAEKPAAVGNRRAARRAAAKASKNGEQENIT